MRLRARAPGKVVVLGEYAVLTGAPALVLAIDRAVQVDLEASDGACRIATLAPEREERVFVPPAPSGVALVDLVLAREAAARQPPPWRAVLDSRAFFLAGRKLGIGSSAATLCAWAMAYGRYCEAHGAPLSSAPTLDSLVALHRAFQGGRGSGLDVAASLTGGLIRYQLAGDGRPHVSSVELPIGVAFAGIFAGKSASTADFVARFEAWRRVDPRRAAARVERLSALAGQGVEAAGAAAGAALLEAVSAYGAELAALGTAVGAEIVTPEHREIENVARECGVAYKVSGAGGGDLGLAMSADPAALQALKSAVGAKGYRVVDLVPDRRGLVVEEQAE